jgi:hypothetical protein
MDVTTRKFLHRAGRALRGDGDQWMRMKFYPDELKDEAIRLVIKHRLSTREAASRLGLRGEVVRVWVRRFRCREVRPSDVDQLRACVQKLATERDTLASIAARLLEKTG